MTRSVLGRQTLTAEDFHVAFVECSAVLKIIHLRLLLPAAERRRAPEMAEGDQWCPPTSITSHLDGHENNR